MCTVTAGILRTSKVSVARSAINHIPRQEFTRSGKAECCCTYNLDWRWRKCSKSGRTTFSPPANGAPRYSMAQAKARPMPVHPFPQLTTRLQQGTAEHRYSPKCPPSLRQGVPDRSVPGWPGRRLGQCQGCAPSCAARTQQAINCHSCIHKGKSTCATASTAALAA